MTTYHEELMKFIESSWPTLYMVGSRGSNPNITANMTKAANELRLCDDLKGPPVVELGRITYKSSGASMYIPKRIAKLLHLNREEDSSLVIFSVEDYGFFLIKDTAIAQRFKPEILERRRRFDFIGCD